MSKKSRRRNKKILGALLLGGLGLAAANKKGKASTNADAIKAMTSNDAYSDDTEFKETVVSTPKTIMDSMPAKAKKNPLSKRIKKNTNEVYTIKGGNTGVGNTKSVFKGDDGYLRSGEDAIPMTGGRFGTYKAAKEMERGMLPPQLRAPRARSTFGSGNDGLSYFKKGGRVKGCGIAKKGFGRAMKKGRK